MSIFDIGVYIFGGAVTGIITGGTAGLCKGVHYPSDFSLDNRHSITEDALLGAIMGTTIGVVGGLIYGLAQQGAE